MNSFDDDSTKQVQPNPPQVTPQPQSASLGPQNHLRKYLIRIFLVILGVICAIILGVALFIFFVWYQVWGIHPNRAMDTAKPIKADLTSLGAHFLCDNGDSGYSIDNREPWYNVYYSISDNSSLTRHIEEKVSKAGYSVRAGVGRIDPPLPGPNDSVDTKSENLQGTNGTNSSTIDIEIVRQGSVPLYCGEVGAYGRQMPVSVGGAIVIVTVSFPNTN